MFYAPFTGAWFSKEITYKMRNTDYKPNLARRIKRSGPIFTKGHFPTKKNNNTLYFESFLELTALLHFEFEGDIILVDTQPFSILYLFKGRMVRYTPDVFVVYIDNNGNERKVYIEVKPSTKLGTPENKIKFDTLKALFAKLGKEFITFDELEMTRTKLKNLELLFQGASVFGDVLPYIDKMLALLPMQITLEDARQQIISAGLHENHIHYLLFKQYYHVDLEQPLTNISLIQLNVA